MSAAEAMYSVLLVDDDSAWLDEVKEIFEETDLIVITASNQRMAAEVARAPLQPIAAIAVDYHLGPNGDGISLIENLRALGTIGEEVPFFLVTGHEEFDIAKRGLDLGAVALLQKPIQPELLLETTFAAVEKFRIAEAIDRIYRAEGSRKLRRPVRLAANDFSREATVLEFLHKLESDRENVFGGLVDSSSWRILLEVLLSESSKHPATITSVCAGTNLPYATAHRKIHELIAAEILAKSADSIDQRRVLVKLTANGRGKVFEFVGFITEWLQRELAGSKRTD
jgi:CheY-like chemotaxis protein